MHIYLHIYACDARYMPDIHKCVVVTHNASSIQGHYLGSSLDTFIQVYSGSSVNIFVNINFLDFTINIITQKINSINTHMCKWAMTDFFGYSRIFDNCEGREHRGDHTQGVTVQAFGKHFGKILSEIMSSKSIIIPKKKCFQNQY